MEDTFNQGRNLQACSNNIFPECPFTLIVLSCWGANQLLIRKEVIQCLVRGLIWCTVHTSELGKFKVMSPRFEIITFMLFSQQGGKYKNLRWIGFRQHCRLNINFDFDRFLCPLRYLLQPSLVFAGANNFWLRSMLISCKIQWFWQFTIHICVLFMPVHSTILKLLIKSLIARITLGSW